MKPEKKAKNGRQGEGGGARKGDKRAQKHSEEYVLSVLDDIYNGLVSHNMKEIKLSSGDKEDGFSEEKYVQHEGYATLEQGFLRHGLYYQKLNEWSKTWRENNVISDTIKKLRMLRETTLVSNTTTGAIPASVGIFLMKAQLGYTDQPKEEIKKEEVTHDLSKLSNDELKKFTELMKKVQQ